MGIKAYVLHVTAPATFLLFLLPSRVSIAQTQSMNYPVQFSQFIFSYPMTNPASTGADNNYELGFGYQKPVNGFTGISTYYFNISFLPYRIKKGPKNRSIIGARFFNDNEGAFINRSRFYLTYAFHTRLSGNLKISGGIDFGGMNFTVKATPTTEGASVYKVDAATGIWLYNERFHAGISVNQIFRSVFQPLDERIVLPTYFNVSGSYAIINRENVVIRPHLLLTFPYFNATGVQLSVSSLFVKHLIVAGALNYRKNISFMAGVADLDILGRPLDIVVSYCTTLHKAAFPVTKLEVSAGYCF